MSDQIATLGITVDANGAIRQVTLLDTSLGKLGTTSRGMTQGISELGAIQKQAGEHAGAHSLGINRLERAMSGGIEKAAGMNNVLGLLGTTFLKFGVGDIYTIAIVGGLYAIVKAWDVLTASAREAAKAQETGINSALKMLQMKGAGPGGATTLDYAQENARMIGLQSQKKTLEANMATRGELGAYGALITKYSDKGRLADLNDQIGDLADVMKATKRVMDADNAKENVRTLGEAQRKQEEAHRKAEAALIKLQEETIRYNEMIKSAYRGTFDIYAPARGPRSTWSAGSGLPMSPAESGAIGDQAMSSINAENKTAQDASLFLAVQAYKDGTGKLLTEQQKSTQKLSDVMWGSAAAGANAIVSALNIGGGGRGSNLGGALGSTAGFAIGYGFGGPVGGAIGATAGNIFGSLVGGLFDHKKAVDKNTQAVNALTAALNNAPAGYKVAGARYRADDGRQIYAATATESYNRKLRGGVGNMGMAA